MTYQTLRFAVADGLAHLTMDTHDGRNAIDQQMAEELAEVAIQCRDRADIRAVLVDGAGANFCVGGDIQSFTGMDDGLAAVLLDRTMYFHHAISMLSNARAPIVMAVHGNVVGGGIAFLTAADIVIAAASTTFRVGYTAIGLTPDGGASFSLPRLIGLRRSLDLALTNRPFGAEEALSWGLISHRVADEALTEEAGKLARKLAAGPSAAFGATRSLLRSSHTATLESHLAKEALAIAEAARTADGQEGIAAFMAKRKPVFRGA